MLAVLQELASRLLKLEELSLDESAEGILSKSCVRTTKERAFGVEVFHRERRHRRNWQQMEWYMVGGGPAGMQHIDYCISCVRTFLPADATKKEMAHRNFILFLILTLLDHSNKA